MCRLLGFSAPVATTFEEACGENFNQFISLANDHCDGWGLATAHEDQIDLFKEPVSATKSSNFKTEIRSHNATAGLLHLRWATEGMSVNENNTHPFCYQDISFIHNGSITPPDHLDPLIDKKYLALAKGNTDSERYFLYLLTQIDKHGFSEGVKAGVKYIKENLKYSAINMMIINKASFISAWQQDPQRVAAMDEADVERLLQDAGIVRNRLKINSAIRNARVFLAMQQKHGSFARWLWDHVDGQPLQNQCLRLPCCCQ